MKKRILLFIFAVFALAAVLTSCAKPYVADKGSATLVIETDKSGDEKYEIYTVDLEELEDKSNGAFALLEYFAKSENGGLKYESYDAGYGAYITSISGMDVDSTCQYVAIYTSVEKDFAVPSEYFPTVATVKYNDVTLTYSGVGMSSMTVEENTVILLRIEEF